jgi:Flp pilus assembly protein TadG
VIAKVFVGLFSRDSLAIGGDPMLIARKRRELGRRGVSAVEAAIVYPLAILLLLGTVVLGLGVFRYQQLQALAREGARYASVHGPQYASDSGNAYATNQTVLTQIETLAVGMQTSNLTCTVTWSPNPPTTTTPSTVSVNLTYDWVPEGYFQSFTMSATSVMPVTY